MVLNLRRHLSIRRWTIPLHCFWWLGLVILEDILNWIFSWSVKISGLLDTAIATLYNHVRETCKINNKIFVSFLTFWHEFHMYILYIMDMNKFCGSHMKWPGVPHTECYCDRSQLVTQLFFFSLFFWNFLTGNCLCNISNVLKIPIENTTTYFLWLFFTSNISETLSKCKTFCFSFLQCLVNIPGKTNAFSLSKI